MSNLGCSLMKEITKTEVAIKECYNRVERLEKQLNLEEFPPDKRKTLELELEEVKKLLQTNNEVLKKLHTHNRSNFLIAFAILSIFIMFFVLFQFLKGTYNVQDP